MADGGGKDGAPRSAYEIAMEKLASRDKAEGLAPRKKLSDKKKKEIAETRSYYEAKLAEREILFKSEMAKAYATPEKIPEVEKSYATDKGRLENERDEKIARIRG